MVDDVAGSRKELRNQISFHIIRLMYRIMMLKYQLNVAIRAGKRNPIKLFDAILLLMSSHVQPPVCIKVLWLRVLYLNSNETLEHNQLKVSTMFGMCAKAVTLFEDIMVRSLVIDKSSESSNQNTLYSLVSVHSSIKYHSKQAPELKMVFNGKKLFLSSSLLSNRFTI